MADKEYLLKWVIDPTKAVSGAQAIERELLNLERIVDRLGPKLKGLAAGASTSMGGASRSAATLTARLDALESQAQQASAALHGVGSAAGGIHAGTTRAANSAQGLSGSLVAVGAAYAGVRLVADVGEALAEALDKAREFARKTAEENIALRDSLRELKNLQGEGTTSDEVARQQLDFMARTATTASEAEAFQSEFMGAVDASRDRWTATHDANGKPLPGVKEMGMAPDVIEPMGEVAATFATRSGLDMETAGKLTGLLGEYDKIDTVQKGAEVLGGIGDHLNRTGVGKVATLAKPFLGLMADMSGEGGRMADPVEAAAMFSVTTRRAKSGATAATSMRQANRLLRKAAFSEDEGVKALGITPDDDYITALRKIAPTVLAKGADQWMIDHNLGKNSTERDSIIKQAKLLPVMDVAINDPEAKAAARGTIDANRKFLQSDPSAKNRIAEARNLQARDTRGQEARDFTVMSKLAEADLQMNHEIETRESNTEEAIKDFFVPKPLRGALGLDAARQRKINNRIARGFLGSVPNAKTRFPDMFADNGADGVGIRNPNSEQVTNAINSLSPEEKEKLREVMEKRSGRRDTIDTPALRSLPASGQGVLGGGVPAGRKPGGPGEKFQKDAGAGGDWEGAGGHASIQAPEIKEAGQIMMKAAQAMLQASRSGNGQDSHGLAFDLPETTGFMPVRS